MSVSLRDVEYVLAVAGRGTLARAAEELGVTQPTLTKAVQRVEGWFGAPLFERTGRGMVLSSAGLRAVEQLRRLRVAYADTEVLAQDMRAQQAGLLRIGVTDASGEERVVRALAAILSALSGGLGWLWGSWDSRRQTWHDRIAGTVVVRDDTGRSLV